MIRIVKMTFKASAIETFQSTFEEYKEKIRAVNGCERLELLQDINNPCIFFTYSFWNEPASLENYRHSALFKEVWSKTKVHFDDKPEAWSVDQKVVLP